MMMKKQTTNKRINVTFSEEEYNQIRNLAGKNNECMSALVRSWAEQGLNGTLTEDNISVLVPIIREQVENVLSPKMERMIALTVKTCIQAGTATYLTAETIANLLPDELQLDYREAYEAARKKAVAYIKSKSSDQ
jgi:hypothetical protein